MNTRESVYLFVAALCLATGISSGSGQNIVPNPGFETGTMNGWQGNCVVTTAASHTGLYSAALGDLALTFDAIPVDRIVGASFWLKDATLTNSFAWYSVWMETRTGEPLVGAVPLRPWSLDWQQYGIGLGPHPDCVVRGVSFGGWGSYLDDVQIVLNARQVKIDIKPDDSGNEVNLKSKGSLSVAILGSSLFNVHDVDPSSLLLDGTAPMPRGKKETIGNFDDVNKDSFPDLVVTFSSADLSFPPRTDVAELSGRLSDGSAFFGTDAIQLVGPLSGMGDVGPVHVQTVPEPAILSSLALGGLAVLRRRR